MQILRESNEAEMIAEFLRQEYASVDRYRASIDAVLADLGMPSEHITEADISNDRANEYRRRLFGRYRGYGEARTSFFTDFPTKGVIWSWVRLTKAELLATRFVIYWADIWGGYSEPRVLAAAIRAGDIPAWAQRDRAVDNLMEMADLVRNGTTFPPLLLVSADDGAHRVVMEGNSRLTAYALAEDALPEAIDVLLGCSPDIAKWDEYSS